MISVEEQTQLAIAFVKNVAGGGADESQYADDLTVWTSTAGLISREDYLPRLARAAKLWKIPLEMTIDSVTAIPGRVVLQTRSHGVLFNGAEYGNSYIFLIEFNEQGQFRHIREYYDPDRIRNIFHPAMAEWKALHDAA